MTFKVLIGMSYCAVRKSNIHTTSYFRALFHSDLMYSYYIGRQIIINK